MNFDALTEEEEIELLQLLEQEEREKVSPKIEKLRHPSIGGDCPTSIRIKGVRGGRGAGAKCLKVGTLVWMFDGTLKKVEEIKPGDRVMGPDSTPRNVLSIASGEGRLLEVRQTNGINYIVNEDHILTLKNMNEIIDIGIIDFIESSLTYFYKGFRVDIDSKKITESDIGVRNAGFGEWAGFQTDGDHRFLLEDGTVTHNSHSIVSLVVQRAQEQRLRIGCFREIQLSLEESVYQLIMDKVEFLGYTGWKFNKDAIYAPNGSKFIFRGLKDLRAANNVKGLENFDIFLIEEAASISMESWNLLLPTIMRVPGSELYFAYNPEEELDPVTEKIWNRNRKDAICLEMEPGPADNPWWNDGLQTEMEEDFKFDPDEAEHIWYGLPRKQGQKSVMARAIVRQAMDRNGSDEGQISIGADIARYGDDKSVFYKRKGMKVIDKKKFSKQSIPETARELWDFAGRDPSIPIKVDDTGVGCFTKNSQVLTPNGFRYVKDLKEGDLVYSKNNNNEMVVERVLSNTTREKTHIINISGHEFSNAHMLPIKSRKEYNFKLSDWMDVSERKNVILDDDHKWIGEYNGLKFDKKILTMPNGGVRTYENSFDVSGEQIADFLGWFLSEGYFVGKTGLGISQKKCKNFQLIINAMKPFGKVQIKKGCFIIFNSNLYNWIKDNCLAIGVGRNCYNWKVPDLIKTNTTDVINIFLNSFVRGDGYIKSGCRYFLTTSMNLRNDVFELLIKIGKSCNWYIKQKAGSKSNIYEREIIRKKDCYVIFEYKKRTSLCIKKGDEIKRSFDNVYYLTISGQTKLLLSTNKYKRPFWTHNGGVSDLLKEWGAKVIPINFATNAVDTDRYGDIVSEMWFTFPIDQADIPDDSQLMKELSGRQYTYDKKNRRKIEPKDEFKKRIGHSPDDADAIILCYYEAKTLSLDNDARLALAARRRR